MTYKNKPSEVLQTDDTRTEYIAENSGTAGDLNLDIAYNEIAIARANCIKAAHRNFITQNQFNLALTSFLDDLKKLDRLPSGELQKLVKRYTEENKSQVYFIKGSKVACL